MTGDYSEQAIFLNHGKGSNGKSVALDVLSMIIGGYAQVTPIETLLTSRNKQGRIPNDVARMKGKRFLKCSENAEGRRIDEALLKQLTGGEEIVARFMRAEFFEFRMQGKIHLTSNFLSHIGDDDATWRRVHLIPWLVTIDKDKQDKYLARRLYEEEAPGIFNRLLAGLARLAGQGGAWARRTPPRRRSRSTGRTRTPWARRSTELFTEHKDHTECTSRCKGHLINRSGDYLFDEYRRWAGPRRWAARPSTTSWRRAGTSAVSTSTRRCSLSSNPGSRGSDGYPVWRWRHYRSSFPHRQARFLHQIPGFFTN